MLSLPLSLFLLQILRLFILFYFDKLLLLMIHPYLVIVDSFIFTILLLYLLSRFRLLFFIPLSYRNMHLLFPQHFVSFLLICAEVVFLGGLGFDSFLEGDGLVAF